MVQAHLPDLLINLAVDLTPTEDNPMTRIISMGSAALLLASILPAHAEQTTGVVRSVNAWTGVLTLQSGEAFRFDDPFLLNGIAPGDRVGVFHQRGNGVNVYDPDPAIRDDIDVN
ncbi:hypothetical protein OSH11_01735 [Kaistia dalseonensis]|uniref:Uncharacterized protein n=1 Tax=Kaistia dalseonensis TaxID=410840 RepID=A0ABU0H389_9HYPH|nr:hypothetical protein [Kaistia dalseonensis]MCX5493416.1 hypothetical protein [Kaistia dalseonensis]MDQ0435974.1 hypothetical protein [Kaistia dalseonensis]